MIQNLLDWPFLYSRNILFLLQFFGFKIHRKDFRVASLVKFRSPLTYAEPLLEQELITFINKIHKLLLVLRSDNISGESLCLAGHKPVELVYKVPAEVEGLSDINYSTDVADCYRLWKQYVALVMLSQI